MNIAALVTGVWFSIVSFFGFGQVGTSTPPVLEEHDDSVEEFISDEEVHEHDGVPHTHASVAASTHTSDTSKELMYGSAVVTTDDAYRYIVADGLPNHETGSFPNPGNPNAISAQEHSYRVTLNPTYAAAITETPMPGVALNGIPLEPATAEQYRNTDWTLEAFDADGVGGLGIDWSNAHVQPDGSYHYHAVPEGLLASARADQSGDLILLAWASDGFPIYYSESNAYSSSWQLKSGTRPSGPGGRYDGTYTEDFEYVSGSGDLDECNGIMLEEEYAYFFTDSFPYIQRCVHGTPDPSFNSFGANRTPAQTRTGDGGGATPPEAARTACSTQREGSACSFRPGGTGTVSGTCRIPPGQDALVCVP